MMGFDKLTFQGERIQVVNCRFFSFVVSLSNRERKINADHALV